MQNEFEKGSGILFSKYRSYFEGKTRKPKGEIADFGTSKYARSTEVQWSTAGSTLEVRSKYGWSTVEVRSKYGSTLKYGKKYRSTAEVWKYRSTEVRKYMKYGKKYSKKYRSTAEVRKYRSLLFPPCASFKVKSRRQTKKKRWVKTQTAVTALGY